MANTRVCVCIQVYERIDWRDLQMSRATRASCGRDQIATSYEASVGASLYLKLKESERECKCRRTTSERLSFLARKKFDFSN